MTGAGASQPSILEETEIRPRLNDGPWKVVLWDDDFHTYEYVIEMLMDVCQMPWEKAFQHAVEVDTRKKTIVFTGELEHAEFVHERILNYGPDPRMGSSKGSMTATLEK
ncbi:ATP-dependent Clp protease adaptor ClpS [Leptospira noumeaensis]|uniref:ATP-dependent Clp protease adaptor ClpS n=1 Tax=Leptospira noumeaensis TaxID=2484964 RepID=A0A4R9IAM2_9LEPT|nr:ATP-dependent Clp protease adaptor ClpS [Leptospira noumeaensis]TGK82599.1 ATP-dependent Clp protease adaptor ClpS [Leptospira noumeaensis]